jgi:hypothetical protein
MVKKILTEAGFIENKTFKETRFLKAPTDSYCVYMDSFHRRGGDDINLITEHTYTIELYAYRTDPDAEKRIENALDKFGIVFDKDDRYWIESEQLYQTIYTFGYIEK